MINEGITGSCAHRELLALSEPQLSWSSPRLLHLKNDMIKNTSPTSSGLRLGK